MNESGICNTRHGGQCLAAAHHAGAPFLLITAIKEIGMLQRHSGVNGSPTLTPGRLGKIDPPG